MYRELYCFGGMTFALESDAPLERSPVCEVFHVPDGVPDHTICLRFSDALPTPPADALRRDDVFRWQVGAQLVWAISLAAPICGACAGR